MQARLLSEGEWFNRRLHNHVSKERFIDMSLNISTRADLLQYEKFLEHRMVTLWDCRGSVAKYCMEFREELILETGEILAAQPMGLLFNVAGPQQPPQYVSALEAAKVLPSDKSQPSSLTFFKLRHSPRTEQLTTKLKRALSATPSMLANPSLAKQLGTNGTPQIAIRNSPNFSKKLITAKLLEGNP